MARGDLTEAMARSRLSHGTNIAWDEAREDTKEWICDVVAPEVDVVVGFVAAWFLHWNGLSAFPNRNVGDILAEAWREDMA